MRDFVEIKMRDEISFGLSHYLLAHRPAHNSAISNLDVSSKKIDAHTHARYKHEARPWQSVVTFARLLRTPVLDMY